MNLHPMKLVTIICESLARAAVEQILSEVGARGFTVFHVAGWGAHGSRGGDIPETTNLQFEVVLQPDAATRLLERVGSELFGRFAMIAHESDVRVLRGDKF